MTAASQFYESAASGLGRDFLDDVQRGIDHLRKHPKLGHSVGRGLRRMLLQRFPFSLIYSIEAGRILIVAVAHHGRRPRYWQRRIE